MSNNSNWLLENLFTRPSQGKQAAIGSSFPQLRGAERQRGDEAIPSVSGTASWLLTDLFRRPSLNVLLGPLGSKKTWLGLDLAVSVAAGGGWLGFRGPQSPALFIDQALGDRAVSERVRSILVARHAPSNTPFYFCSRFHSSIEPQEFEFLLSTTRSVKAGLIVFDSPFGLHLYLDRHKLHSFAPALANLHRLAVSVNATVLLLHDLSKHRTDLAAPLLDMGVDHVLAVEPSAKDPIVHLRTLAAQNLVPVSILARFNSNGSFGLSSSPSTPTTLGIAGFELIRHLILLRQATTAQLMAGVRSAVPTRVRTLIHEMVTGGYIHRTNPGGHGSPAIYALTPAGRALLRGL